jgi:hypothetical protein
MWSVNRLFHKPSRTYYTNVAQLPLAATARKLPSASDSQIDSQNLVTDHFTVSPSVLGVKSIKVGKAVGKIGGNHYPSLTVTNGRQN